MSNPNPELSAQLKEEGNKFFTSKQFSQAHDKYTKALKVGGNNAIIYANRAACCHSMGRYLDACSDARKATEIDPDYAKAWGRLAAAQQELGSLEKAVDAYEKALSKLPQSNPSAAEKKQKEQYESGLSQAKKKMEARDSEVHVHTTRSARLRESPHQRAKAIIKEAEENGKLEELIFSSVHTIFMASGDFEAGLEGMREWKYQRINGQLSVYGRLDVVDNLSNAVLSDRRSFYINDPKFLEKYNKHMVLLVQKSGAWNEGGPELVLEEAQKRVKERGWDATRQAISATVRGWIMRAFLSAGLQGDYTGAEQFYRNAIDVLERGRKIWPNVPKDDRGAVFEFTFLFGVRAIHLEAFMQAHQSTGGTDPRFSAEALDKLATDLFLDVEKARREVGPFYRMRIGEGFFLSYFVYPAAEASALKAYALKHKARDKKPEEAAQFWGESAEYYALAAKMLPKDDEYHCQYLMNSLDSWWWFADTPLKTTLPLLAQLKENVPKMKRIWEYSALAMDGRDAKIKQCLDYYEDMQNKIQAGTLTENDSYNPPVHI